MYISRFAFHTVPGKSGQLEDQLGRLSEMVVAAGGKMPRVLHTHFASIDAPDVVFEQEATDLADLESQITKLTESQDFQLWTKKVSGLLLRSPKREIYIARNSPSS